MRGHPNLRLEEANVLPMSMPNVLPMCVPAALPCPLPKEREHASAVYLSGPNISNASEKPLKGFQETSETRTPN
jgi:hypothetical protein